MEENNQVILKTKNKTSITIAGSIYQQNKITHLNKSDTSSGVSIALSQSDKAYRVIYNLKCNPESNYLSNTSWQISNDKRTFTLLANSKFACPQENPYEPFNIQILGILDFLDSYKIIVGIILIILGIIEMLFGYYLLKKAVVLITTILFVLFLILILISILPSSVLWLAVLISLLFGFALYYYLYKFNENIYAMIVGLVSGYFMGTYIYGFFLSRIKWKPSLIRWSVTVVFMIFCSLLPLCSCFLGDYLFIFFTSFTGAYILIKGIGYVTGGLPDEIKVLDLAENGNWEEVKKTLNWKAYLCLSAILLLTLFGCIVQLYLRARKKRKEENEQEIEANDYGILGIN